MARTAVILAFNYRNTGMYSVDLAAFRFFEALGGTVDYFTTVGQGAIGLVKFGHIPIYHLSGPDILRGYDSIVFWGDFTTSPSYGLDDFHAQLRNQDGKISQAAAFDLWAQTFLLKDQDKGERRFFSFGQSFQTLPAAAAQQDLCPLAPLYERFDMIMPRDTVSTAVLSAAFPGVSPAALVQGTDCALLLNERPDDGHSARRGTVGGFFFRSRIRNVAALGTALTKRGHRIVNIEQWLKLPTNRPHEYFRMKCEMLRGFDCVLTDTYHFAVNAIREGATPILLGREEQAQVTTVSEYKKKILLGDLGAAELYTEVNDDLLEDEQIERIVAQVDALVGAAQPHPLHERARQLADHARSEFTRRFLGH